MSDSDDVCGCCGKVLESSGSGGVVTRGGVMLVCDNFQCFRTLLRRDDVCTLGELGAETDRKKELN